MNSVLTIPLPKKPLPVTVLSGFLGSGKTTLLQHILHDNSNLPNEFVTSTTATDNNNDNNHIDKKSNDHSDLAEKGTTVPARKKIAVLVNDMAEVNIDAALIKKSRTGLGATGDDGGTRSYDLPEKIVEMQNGCICCTLREDLLEQVVQLAMDGSIDHLVIESTGISEPIAVAETFTFGVEIGAIPPGSGVSQLISNDAEKNQNGTEEKNLKNGKHHEEHEGEHESHFCANKFNDCEHESHQNEKTVPLSKLARLDCMVTVVDALNFLVNFQTREMARDRWGENVDDEDNRNITDLLIDQVEFANVILLNKVDLVSSSQRKEVKSIVRALNTKAKIIETEYSRVPLEEILDTALFSFEEAKSYSGWLTSIQGAAGINNSKVPETEEYGISSFIYRARRPFDPMAFKGLMDRLSDEHENGIGGGHGGVKIGVLRAKGFVWLATRNLYYGDWSHAGLLSNLGPGDYWYAALPEDEWESPDDPEYVSRIKADFDASDARIGDRRQEIVVIGKDMDHDKIRKMLDDCLISEADFAGDWGAWKELFQDPFPPWDPVDELESHDKDESEEDEEKKEGKEEQDDDREEDSGMENAKRNENEQKKEKCREAPKKKSRIM